MDEIFFVTPIGKFEFKKGPFGLVHVPAHSPQLTKEVLKGLPFAFGYLDEILIFNENTDKHIEYLTTVFDRLRTTNLKLN